LPTRQTLTCCSLSGAVIQAACDNHSLPLFELCLQHGYHPNRQIPSNDGRFGTALTHCIDNEDITRFLLQNGADANVAPFHDNRLLNWGPRATPPMDRTSGLALDRAVKTGNSTVIQMLLDHGANPRYSRPLHGVIQRHKDQGDATSGDWRSLMETLLEHGADVNGVTYSGGTPLTRAVANQMWDIAEFLLERGADPRRVQPASGLDAFGTAAKQARVAWEETEEVKKFLSWLCDPEAKSILEDPSFVPEGVRQNPLVGIIARTNKKELRED
jgi:hypothetical protein